MQFRHRIAIAAAFFAVFIVPAFHARADAGAAGQLKIATFIMARQVDGLLSTDAGRKQALETLNEIGVTKVYLDAYRDGLITPPEKMASLRDFFRENGYEVSAGFTPTKGIGVGSPTHRYWLCYNYSETRNAIRGIIENTARNFDQIIVDDFLATDCRCPECGALKGSRDWGQFFRDTLVDVSLEDIVEAAKKANPNVNMIIKYPQWYDRFHAMGYDTARQPEIYDNVWVGTETRDPKKENVQQYEGFVNFTWLKSIGGRKTLGAWFDWINCYPEVYMEQAYQSVLAGADEIVLFGYLPETFQTDNLRLFTKKRPDLVKMHAAISGFAHEGIFAYKPPNSPPGADTYIFDYMGMLGLPLVMSGTFPSQARAVFLGEHALADPEIAQKTLALLKSGGTVIATAGFVAGMKGDAAVMAAAGFDGGDIKKSSKRMALDFALADGTKIKAPGYVLLGGSITPGAGAKTLASTEAGGKTMPYITVSDAAGGRFITLNARTYESEPNASDLTVSGAVLLPNMPDAVSAILRSESVAPLGVTLSGPSRVGVYFYRRGNEAIVAFDNFNDADAVMKISFEAAKFGMIPSALDDVLTGEKIVSSGDVFTVPVPKRSMRMFKLYGD